MRTLFFVFTFLLLGSDGLTGQNVVMRSSVPYTESEMRQFNITVDDAVFQALIKKVEKSKRFQSDKTCMIAGFVFIPIWKVTEADSTFFTEGFGVAVVYWCGFGGEPLDALYDRTINVFGFENLPEADIKEAVKYFSFFQNQTRPRPDTIIILKERMLTTQGAFCQAKDSAGTTYAGMREFDLAYLDIHTYKDFATSSRFYDNNNRTSKGIHLSRSMISIDMTPGVCEEDGKNISSFRTLCIRPFPIPALKSGKAGESAIAFEFVPTCPPHWRNDYLLPKGNDEKYLEIQLKEMVNAHYPWGKEQQKKSNNYLTVILGVGFLITFLLFLFVYRKYSLLKKSR